MERGVGAHLCGRSSMRQRRQMMWQFFNINEWLAMVYGESDEEG
jgi:hypothetical protein